MCSLICSTRTGYPDPYRFTVTKSEEASLISKNIDPIKVKCAILALRLSMDTTNVSSELSLFAGRSDITTDALCKIRELRRGIIQEVTMANGMHFDCRQLENSPVAEVSNVTPEIIPMAVAINATIPSAPHLK